MNNNYGFIYITTNIINNKKYIGQSIYGKKDWETYLGSGKLIRRAIKKYGSNNFTREIIHEAKTKEELDSLEKYYINLYNATESEDFYNIHEGGSGGNTIKGFSKEELYRFRERMSEVTKGTRNGMYGRKHSMVTKDKIRLKRLNNSSSYTTKQFREKMSKITRGSNNGMYNRNHSEESRKLMSVSQSGKWSGEKNPMFGKTGEKAINGKKVYMLDDKEKVVKEFNTMKLAQEFLNIKGHTALCRACKNGTKYRGYYWRKD